MRPCSPTGRRCWCAPSRRATRMPSSPCTRGGEDALPPVRGRVRPHPPSRRYFGARPHLSPADVERFTRVDGRARFALVAMRGIGVPDELPPAMVGVARYEGRPGRRSAELAVVVDDVLQRSGLGRLMIGRLVDIAREAGLEELVADVLAGNAAMLGLLRGLGLPRRTESDGETVTVVLDLTGLELPVDRRTRARAHLALAGVAASPS